MKALVKEQAAPGIWLKDIPEPKVGPNDVLIEIAKTAICGTDMHIYKWDAWAQKTIPVPMAVGHEYCGRIVELGSEVKGLKTGDRVSGEGHITCGYCRNCRAGRRHLCRNTIGVGVNRPGAFAQYLAIPAGNTFKLPDSIGDDIASILDPLGNATHTALAFNMIGEDVLITGAGPIGLMAVAIARFTDARHVVITDVNDYRLALARRMGATRAINIGRESLDATMKDLGMQEGFDDAGRPGLRGNRIRRPDHRRPKRPGACHRDRAPNGLPLRNEPQSGHGQLRPASPGLPSRATHATATRLQRADRARH